MNIIAYIYESQQNTESKFNCIDCTSKRFTKDYIEKIPSDLALTDDDLKHFHNYLRAFNQSPIKDLVCGTCNKIIADEWGVVEYK